MDTYLIDAHGISPANATAKAYHELRNWIDTEEGEVQHLAMSVTHVPGNDRDAQYYCGIIVVFKLKPPRKG